MADLVFPLIISGTAQILTALRMQAQLDLQTQYSLDHCTGGVVFSAVSKPAQPDQAFSKTQISWLLCDVYSPPRYIPE